MRELTFSLPEKSHFEGDETPLIRAVRRPVAHRAADCSSGRESDRRTVSAIYWGPSVCVCGVHKTPSAVCVETRANVLPSEMSHFEGDEAIKKRRALIKLVRRAGRASCLMLRLISAGPRAGGRDDVIMQRWRRAARIGCP